MLSPFEFVDALADAAMVVDLGGAIVADNGAARDIFRLNLRGLQLTSILRNEVLATAMAEVRRSRSSTSVDVDIHAGPQRQFGIHIAQLGAEGHLLVLLRDLTREQRVEKMRADFIANASHEMRTPLASIMGIIETLQGAAKSDAKAQDRFLGTMLQQAQRMKLLIDDLLALSRVEINEHQQPRVKADLADAARQACSHLSALAAAAKVTISCSAEKPAIVRGDAEELLQVALNLVENAVKYGASGERVLVSVSAEGDHAVLAVRDFGSGIEPDHIPRLTERFYRVNTRESRALGGTGLGLAIVKHIVARHRGRLDITSKPGDGSLFSVHIPF
jgi:two-component system, OmpR family, phosphate regulon sensor histidine kinase PhoR